MKTLFQFTIAILFLSSCAKEADTFLSSTVTTIATPRSAGNMSVSITTVDRSTVTVNTSKVAATFLSEDTFTIVTNPGTLAQQTFTATEATITEPDTKLKVTKNPGVNQITYSDKSTCYITASTESQLIVSIQPGNITTNALSIVGDENDGL